jgi:hypothetical protein
MPQVEDVPSLELELSGPYHYPHDVHPCIRVAAPDRIFASIYIVDGDEDRAWSEAYLLKEAFRLGGKEIDRIHYASGAEKANVWVEGGNEHLRGQD